MIDLLLGILLTHWVNFLFIIFAMIMNAGMDSLDHNFNTSFAKNWSETFWNPALSWKRKYLIPDWIPDAFSDGWHTLKMLMLGFLMIAMSYNTTGSFWTDLFLFTVYAIVWNVPFPLVYTKLRGK